MSEVEHIGTIPGCYCQGCFDGAGHNAVALDEDRRELLQIRWAAEEAAQRPIQVPGL